MNNLTLPQHKGSIDKAVEPCQAVLLAISGKQFSGKTTLANALVAEACVAAYSPTRMALADPMKDLVKKGLHREDREAWQLFGTEVVRDGCARYFGDGDFWVNLYLGNVKDKIDQGFDFILCDDVRFPNEADGLKAAGFKLIRLEASEDVRMLRGQQTGKEYIPGHLSERALDSYPEHHYDLVLNSGQESVDTMVPAIWSRFQIS